MASPVGGDTQGNLPKHIFWIEWDSVLFQQSLEFLLVTHLPVMLFLVGNVSLHHSQVRCTHAESAIPLLPVEFHSMVIHPS